MGLRIAYLAPAIPALSATFVYEELLALERRGFSVVVISVHKPDVEAKSQDSISKKRIIVYSLPRWKVVFAGLSELMKLPGLRQALSWLVDDIRQLGFSVAALKLLFQFLAGAKVARSIRAYDVRHLHIHFAHVPTQIGMYAAAFAGIPFTVMAHANDIFERGSLLATKARRAKKFLTISDYNQAYLVSQGVKVSDMAVVRCGVSFPARWAKRRLSFRVDPA